MSSTTVRPLTERRSRTCVATLLVRDHLQGDHRDVGADAGDDVGVVDRHALGVDRVEGHRLVAEVGAEPLEDVGVGPVAARRVGDPRHVVEHHRAGALEEDAVGFQAGVVHDGLDPVLRLEQLQHVGATLVAAVGGVHRVDRDVAPRVGGEPVVREDAVRAGVVLVLEDVDRHAGVAEGLGDGVHLGQGLGRRRVVGLPLRDDRAGTRCRPPWRGWG